MNDSLFTHTLAKLGAWVEALMSELRHGTINLHGCRNNDGTLSVASTLFSPNRCCRVYFIYARLRTSAIGQNFRSELVLYALEFNRRYTDTDQSGRPVQSRVCSNTTVVDHNFNHRSVSSQACIEICEKITPDADRNLL